MFPQIQKTYQDFILKIERADGGNYRVEAQCLAGEAQSVFRLPFEEKDLQILLLQVGRPRRSKLRGRVPEPIQQTVEFGNNLFNAVISGDVRDVFVRAQQEAEGTHCGLRVQLRLNAVPELADLPWEFLYDGHSFLALSDETPIVRYMEMPNPPHPMHVELPLRVLMTVSSPHNLLPLDVGQEIARVSEALSELIERGLVQLDATPDAGLNTLRHTLRAAKIAGRPYHVWHYIGHGTFDPTSQSSVLELTDADGMSNCVGGFQLGALFKSYPEMRLVLLNACEGARVDRSDPFSGVAAALVESGIPAVIGMQFEITDEAAITLASEFYNALVQGLPVDASLAEARRGVFFLPNWVEWATPVLFMRVKDGHLFEVTGEPRAVIFPGSVPRVIPLVPDGSDILSKLTLPFEWCPIPAGRVTLEDNAGTFDVLPFWIAKYPITYAQFRVFLDAKDGFHDPRWWQGLAASPDHRNQSGDQQWRIHNHPCENVSWWDAVAFCQWLNSRLGLPPIPPGLTTETLESYIGIRLPTEWEWQWAAQGPDGRAFPWGDEYVAGYANIKETDNKTGPNNMRQTTQVGNYPQGASPYGALDMVGNLWDWCLNEYDRPTNVALGGSNTRVLRGGSWFSNSSTARVTNRDFNLPYDRYNYDGFRLCVRPPLVSAPLIEP